MLESTKFDVPPAVVVGVCGHGLAMVRALKAGGARVLALEANASLPGTRTTLAEVLVVPAIHGDGLIRALLELRPRIDCPGLPVLFLTNDAMVRTVGECWPQLHGHYALSWAAARDRLTPLLDKPALEARCSVSGVAYPRTFLLKGIEHTDEAARTIGFPMIVKPARPLSRFKTAQPGNVEELDSLASRFGSDLPFLVQQFVPGDDSTIHFCALYLDRGRVVARFDGHKLRSRPLGHTSIAEASPNEAVHAATVRFFEGLLLSGPVSLELKRDPSGSLWVIEPTVGRTDFWVGLCVENGVNLPLIEYRHQLGEQIQPVTQTDRVVWFNEDRDPLGRHWVTRQPGMGMRGRRSAFVYLNWDDPLPALAFLRHTLRDRLAAVARRLRRVLA